MYVTTIGLDLAKNVFQVHGVTEEGEIAFNRSLRRTQVLPFFQRLGRCCVVGMEACGTSHYWAREITKLGHHVRLIPPSYVKPYVKRGKSDAVDAEAICEAVTRPRMRFVEIKTADQQALLFLHRGRDLIVRQCTQLINMLRGMLAEFGVTVGQGIGRAIAFARGVIDGLLPDLPEVAQDVIANLSQQLVALDMRVRWYELRMRVEAKKDPRVSLLRTIPGVGPVTASAIVATVGSAAQFRNGREFAAWLGITPLNRSSGGKERLGRITKMGDRYLRRLLIIGMTARVRQVRRYPERSDPWTKAILERKPARLATVAMANKTARIAWAILTRNERFEVRAA
jgi:transposase